MMKPQNSHDPTAAFAEAFFIANLLFVGLFYLALWGLYLLRHRHASAVVGQHLAQTLIASSLSTLIFAAINLFIFLGAGYSSLTALFSLELYYMLIVPVFLAAGIAGFIRAVKGLPFTYPVIGNIAYD